MALPLSQTEDPAERSVAGLLATLGTEFRDLGVLAESLQDLPSRLGGSGCDSATIVAAQGLDVLAQRLHGLAAFSIALAATVPAEWRLDTTAAASLVTLSDLQRRLTSSALEPSLQPDEADGFELF